MNSIQSEKGNTYSQDVKMQMQARSRVYIWFCDY